MGLLDYIGTPEGQGLLSAAFGGLAGARRGTPFNNIGRAGVSGLVGYNQALDQNGELDQRKQRQQLFEMQLKQMQQQQADAQLARDNEAKFRASIASPQQTMLDSAMGDGQGPTMANAAKLAPVDPRNQQLWQAMSTGQIKPMEYLNAITKDDAPVKLGEGETLFSGKASGFKPLASGSAKRASMSEVGRLTAERDALPEGHPSRALYDRAIQKAITPAAGVNVTYGAPVAGVGPDGKTIFFQPGRDGGAPVIVPGVAPPPKEMPESTRNKLAENAVVQEKIAKALELAANNPGSFGLKNVMGDAAMQRLDPVGVEARAFVADLAGQKINDRSGAAVSVGESERLKPYVPSATDTPETVVKKLKGFEAEYKAMARELQSGGTLRQVDVAPTQAPARKYNPATGKLE
jgi:hypothetical protein